MEKSSDLIENLHKKKKTPFRVVVYATGLAGLKTQKSRTKHSFVKTGVLKLTTHQIWDRNGPKIYLDA